MIGKNPHIFCKFKGFVLGQTNLPPDGNDELNSLFAQPNVVLSFLCLPGLLL